MCVDKFEKMAERIEKCCRIDIESIKGVIRVGFDVS